MREIIYLSTARAGTTEATVESILEKSRAKNAEDSVHGALLFDGVHFLQLIEGEHETIGELFKVIEADKRHHKIVKIVDEPIKELRFAEWLMAYIPFSEFRNSKSVAECTKLFDRLNKKDLQPDEARFLFDRLYLSLWKSGATIKK